MHFYGFQAPQLLCLFQAVFAAEQAAEDEDDRPGSPAPSSSFDLTSKRDYSGNDDLEEDIRREDDDDFDNFFTVDEIGEVEQQNEELEKASGGGEQEKKSPEKISLEPSKQKTPEPEKKRKTKEVEEVNVKENSKKEVKEEKKSSEDKDIGESKQATKKMRVRQLRQRLNIRSRPKCCTMTSMSLKHLFFYSPS